MDFVARAYDSDNQEIKDLFFRWYVEPLDGHGTLTAQKRDGTGATFTNVYTDKDGDKRYTGGTCRVKARTVYQGEEKWGVSAAIYMDMAP